MNNIGWVYGVLKHEYNVDTDGMSPDEAFEALREQERREYAESKKQSKKHVELPKDEYAGLCSAVRTLHTNKIPKIGGALYKDSYYRYTYDKNTEQLLCVKKMNIVGNEERIEWEEDFNKWQH